MRHAAVEKEFVYKVVEVPVEKRVEVEKIVYVDRPVEVTKEVIKEVPVQVIQEVIREVNHVF